MGKWIVVLAFAAGADMGESLPPQESNGVKIGEPVVLDLAPWADDISARRGIYRSARRRHPACRRQGCHALGGKPRRHARGPHRRRRLPEIELELRS